MFSTKSLLLSIVLLVISCSYCLVNAQSNLCRAISFSGAGDRGAYEAGVMWGLVDSRTSDQVQWKVVGGISAGAINSASAAMFSVGDEVAAAKFMTDKWLSISQSQVFEEWKGGVLDGLLLQRGIFNTEPLHQFLLNNVNTTLLTQSNRTMYIGATCLETGLFTPFNKEDPDIVLGVLSSASIPGIFPPTLKDGNSYVDGGVTYMTPITDTTRLCWNTGAENVIVDVILGVGKEIDVANYTQSKTLDVLFRSGSIIGHNLNMKDIETVFQAFPSTTINLYFPSQSLPGDFIGFQYSEIMINIGYKDAQSEHNTVTLTKDNYIEMLKGFNLN